MIARTLHALLITIVLASPLTTFAAVWYVDDNGAAGNGCTSWADACPSLQTALGLATTGDQIWVATGIYKPTGPNGDRTISFQLVDAAGLYGGFAGTELALEDRARLFDQTILSGDLTGNDTGDFDDPSRLENSYHVLRNLSADPMTILDGFAISGGHANGDGSFHDAGGLENGGGTLTITNCTFSGNFAQGIGGAIRTLSAGSPTLVNCILRENIAAGHGGAATFFGNFTLTNCTFIRNRVVFNLVGNGGAVWAPGQGGGITNCAFFGNEAANGSAVSTAIGQCKLTNCRFVGNLGGLAVMRIYLGSTASVSNCTFADNTGANVFEVADANTTLVNCIIWANTGDAFSEGGTIPTVTFSDVQGGVSGIGNISDDPLFIDPDGLDNMIGTADDNLRLSPGSPCIDAADNTAVLPDSEDLDGDGNTDEPIPYDLDGNPRFIDDLDTTDTGFGTPPIVDMGAYEFNPCPTDLNWDGVINAADLALILGSWGSCAACPADFDHNGVINAADLALLLGAWGLCS